MLSRIIYCTFVIVTIAFIHVALSLFALCWDVYFDCVVSYRYIGLESRREVSLLYTLVTGITVVLSVILMSWFCRPSYNEDEVRPYTHNRTA